MNYPHFVSKMLSTPWVMVPESLQAMMDIIRMRAEGHKLTDHEIRVRIESENGFGPRQTDGATASKGIGILPLYGPMFQKANFMTHISGATSLETFRDDFRELMNNDRVQAIVMDIDSPGGSTDLVQEVAQEIRAAREVKPIYAVANTFAASGAYYLGSQATQMYSTDSGLVGSLGVYLVHEDWSIHDAKEGVKTTYIHAGKHKVEGNPNEPLSLEAREHMQDIVNQIYDQFVEDVAQGRGTTTEDVASNYGQGRVVSAQDAVSAGMVDGIKTLEQVVMGAWQGDVLPVGGFGKGAAALSVRMQDDIVENEHSEPGSGVPPEPRPQVPDRGGTENNDRIESPPEVLPKPVTGGNPNAAAEFGREVSMNEFLLRMANALGIAVDSEWTEETLVDAIIAGIEDQGRQLAPLREAADQADRVRSFREEFPEEFERMQALEERDRGARAREFSDTYARFVNTNGEPTTRGFAALALARIEESHLKLSSQEFTPNDLKELLDAVASSGTVDYAELGSARTREASGSIGAVDQTPAGAFLQAVQEAMAQDNLDYNAAVTYAAEKHPDLFADYRASIPGRTS